MNLTKEMWMKRVGIVRRGKGNVWGRPSQLRKTLFFLLPLSLSLSHFMFVKAKWFALLHAKEKSIFRPFHDLQLFALNILTSGHVPSQILKGSIDRWYEPLGLYFKEKKGDESKGKKTEILHIDPFPVQNLIFEWRNNIVIIVSIW